MKLIESDLDEVRTVNWPTSEPQYVSRVGFNNGFASRMRLRNTGAY